MAVLLTASLVSVALLTDDRPRVVTGARLVRVGEPAAFPPDPRRSRAIFGIVVRDRARFARLVFPGFLISLGRRARSSRSSTCSSSASSGST